MIASILTSSGLALALLAQSVPGTHPTERPAILHWADIDGDGLQDAFAITRGGQGSLLRNVGDGSFEDLTVPLGLAGPGELLRVQGARFFDADGDGDPDLFLAAPGEVAQVYRLDEGTFVESSDALGLGELHGVEALRLVDLNGDEQVDLSITTLDGERVFVNAGTSGFIELRFQLPPEELPAFVHGDLPTAEKELPGAAGQARRQEARPGGVRFPGGVSGTDSGTVTTGAASGGGITPGGGNIAAGSGPCADAVQDSAPGGSSCIEASTVPTLGMLYPISSELYVDGGTGHVGIGTISPGAALEVVGQLLSGIGNTAPGVESSMGGGRANTALGEQSTVAGGDSNLAGGEESAVGGGLSNRAVGQQSTIAGGLDNAVGNRGFIGGGQSNGADTNFGVIGGGKQNTVSSSYGAVVGGSDNRATGQYSFVGGGGLDGSGVEGNEAAGLASAVMGGRQNSAPGDFSSVTGGQTNQAAGDHSTVGGGLGNVASGAGATVPGGSSNNASGDDSFAAGSGASAGHPGSFVWSDSQAGLASTGPDQFLVQATGGVGIGTDSPLADLDIATVGATPHTTVLVRPQSPNGNAVLQLFDMAGSGAQVMFNGGVNRFHLMDETGTQVLFSLDPATGNATFGGLASGIAGYRLNVDGRIRSSVGGFEFPDGSIQTSSAEPSPWNLNGSTVTYAGGGALVGGVIESSVGGFRFPDGTLQFSAAGGPVWAQSGSDAYYTAGNVGVGIPDPLSRLHVSTNSLGITNTVGDELVVSATDGGLGIYSDESGSNGSKLSLHQVGPNPGGGGNTVLDSWEMIRRTTNAGSTNRLRISHFDHIASDANIVMEMRPDGRVHTPSGGLTVGSDGTDAWLLAEAPAGETAFRVRVDGATRLKVNDDGGVVVGENASSSGALNVRGGTGAGTSAPTLRVDNPNEGIAIYATGNGNNDVVTINQDGVGDVIRGRVGGATRFRVTNSGRVITTALEITGGGDLVEGFESSDGQVEPGTVMIIDSERPGELCASIEAYDSKVAGIVSGANGVNHGIRMGQDDVLDGDTLVAMAGRVWCKVSCENGAIRPGDRLTTASLVGHAMRATDFERSQGSVIGKAMTSLQEGTGLVLVLVNPQ